MCATSLLLGADFSASAQEHSYKLEMDSINSTLTYQRGLISLKNGIAEIQVPEGFKYLDAPQSNYVISSLWGNPDSESSLGMLFPESMGPMDLDSWAFNIQYDEMGYVEDDDAEEIDYDELLVEMQSEASELNAERMQDGYEPISLVGWAAKPYYDQDKHILHWAKELKFGEEEINTLNYNVRVLGRKGVLVLNAIASIDDLEVVNQNIDRVTDIVKFSDGNAYSDFNPTVDKVAAYSIGGLVAGKVLAKAGFFALLLKFWKIIAVAFVAIGSYIVKFFKGSKNEYTH